MSDVLQRTLRQWLRERVRAAFGHRPSASALVVWCDPQRAWKDLLLAAAEGEMYELWVADEHELLLRQRFAAAPRQRPCLVWLPTAVERLTYFKVYALQAEAALDLSLAQGLTEFGLDLPADQPEVIEALPAYAREWLDYTLQDWRVRLGPAPRLDEAVILQVLAADGWALDELVQPELQPVLNRRLQQDYGLPLVNPREVESWRQHCLAALLATQADALLPAQPLPKRDLIIGGKAQRDRALHLLDEWQKRLDYTDAFERLALRADRQAGLEFWARSLSELPPPLAAPGVEQAALQLEIERLDRLQDFDALAARLEQAAPRYLAHAAAFWGSRARARLPWDLLAELAAAAGRLRAARQVEDAWSTAAQALAWYTAEGWQVDQASECLFREDIARLTALPGGLAGVRARLARAYLRLLDRLNAAFSELLAAQPDSAAALPLDYAGTRLAAALEAQGKQPAAVLALDACRYEVGCRIAAAINRGEPAPRAVVQAVRAPLPSITPLGMPFCLAAPGAGLQVDLDAAGSWQVTAAGFAGNLAQAAPRREWLKKTYKLKEDALLGLGDALEAAARGRLTPKTHGRLLFVFDAELDDHDGVLEPYGMDAVAARYVALVRQLRAAGYNAIFIVTDHGFYHGQPEEDEREVGKPDGEIRWKSRRAMVGTDLKHGTALIAPIPYSDLQCCTPRGANVFKTYGRLGFFHGGATLQELITPFVQVIWPVRGRKIGVVLKPISQITSLAQRVQLGPEATQPDLFNKVDEGLTGRLARLRVIIPESGKAVFKSTAAVPIDPAGEAQTLELALVEGSRAALGAALEIQALDADDDEILDRRQVILQVEVDDWL